MRPVTLADRSTFDRYFTEFPPEPCECTFADIFVRAELRHFLWCECEGHLVVAFRGREGCLEFLPPAGPDPEHIMQEHFSGFERYHWARIPKPLTEKLPGVPWELDRNNSDYLYSLADLRALDGKKYDGKRNFIRRMEKENPEFRPITAAMATDCIRIQELWLETQLDNPTAKDESSSLMKAVQHWDHLALTGIGVFVGGEMVSFAIGEHLNPTTYVEHFEKALPGHTGLYPYTTHAFVQSVPAQYQLLNREQDLGIEGLRKSKESWNPVGMTEKYTWKVHGDVCHLPGEMTV